MVLVVEEMVPMLTVAEMVLVKDTVAFGAEVELGNGVGVPVGGAVPVGGGVDEAVEGDAGDDVDEQAVNIATKVITKARISQ